ncbi:MAG TPA: phosphopantetheine-binding protein [Thermoanaerobaculia bacterium]|jgi:acyl carrier protein|nr:phosphopantetheine-binding protein [Thermoanaerobaculia bacterium]
MKTGAQIKDAVLDLLRSRAPLAGNGALPDDLRLGAGGLGLDSIAMVELLLDCERRFGISATGLLEGPVITVGRLIAHVRDAVPQ